MKKISLIFSLLLIVGLCFGQTKPFPQNVTYSYGYKPTTVTSTDAKAMYDEWKAKFVVACGTMKRVTYEDVNNTSSEGQGYGLLLSAYYGDKATFDGLLAFYKARCAKTAATGGLMSWQVTCAGYLGGGNDGSATDGDLDAAYALLVAYQQWGVDAADYYGTAMNILNIIRNSYLTTCNGVITLKPGYTWGGCDVTDVSYYSPAYFRVFAAATGDTYWNTVADNAYYHLWKVYNNNKKNVLVPDFQTADGNAASGRAFYFGWDASRVPWCFAIDYIWNGNTSARDWCKKVSSWTDSIGITNLKSAYYIDGTLNNTQTQYHTAAHVGGMTCGSMCNTQTMVNKFATELKATNGDKSYYNFTLRCIYMLTLTGNFWKPSVTPYFPNGNYTIKSKSNVYLTAVTGNANLNSRTSQNGNYTKFYFKHLGYNIYEISSVQFTSQRMQIANGAIGNGQKVSITSYTGTGNSLKWKVSKVVGGTFQFEPMHNIGFAIDANPLYPTIVQIYSKSTSNNNQLFYLINSSGVTIKSAKTIENNTSVPDLRLYPNPTENELNISNVNTGTYTVSIYNSNGKLYSSTILYFDNQKSINKIYTESLSRGNYIIVLTNEFGNQNSKMFVKK